MSKALTRRTILRTAAASAALAVPAVAAALAAPSDLFPAIAAGEGAAIDPAVVLYGDWHAARVDLLACDRALVAAGEELPDMGDDHPRERIWDRIREARNRLCVTPATTWVGVTLKLRIAHWDQQDSPFEGPDVTGDMDTDLVLSAHADAERLAGGVV